MEHLRLIGSALMTSGRPEVLIADNKLEALSQIFDFPQVLKTCPAIYQDKVKVCLA